eukprot:TRINITY_DN2483_c0_g1_i1.p1 TRINITY_DN2483_c0_g1~~TRINITY_DN2483_c0_g1_i1.p1  ORF type:complete len:656 (+),score=146.25 TRINITY_DN2483_c0_g1_i1:75-2042(+)
MSDEEFSDASDEDYDMSDDNNNDDDMADLDEFDGDSDRFQGLLERDIEEAKAQGYNAGWSHNPLELTVWVGINVSFLEEEFAASCGLYRDKQIVGKLVFTTPPQYMKSHPRAEEKKLMVRQSNDADLNKAKLNDIHTFGLWWTLEQRLNEHLKLKWSTIVASANQAVTNTVDKGDNLIKEVMEMCAVSREMAALAVEKYKNIERISEVLFDESVQAALAKELKNNKNKKKTITTAAAARENNPLVEIATFVKLFLATCTHNCLVCNEPHPLELLKPTVCERQLCNFQLTNLGLGINVESEITNSPHAVDYHICMTIAAASGRHFTPFPSVQSELMVDGQKKSFDFVSDRPSEIAEVLQKLPPMGELQNWVKGGVLKDKLDELHPLLYKLLRWILGTNRAHLHKLEGDQRLSGVQTEWQFVLKSSPPAKEIAFQQHKLEHGSSFYAFHGSPIANWHSILRHGLKNYSGTASQANGAVYGPGIYMAVDSATSLGYARGTSTTWNNSAFGTGLRCMALCEVIQYGPTEPKDCIGRLHRPNCHHKSNAPFYRLEEEEFICTRFLLLYPGNGSVNLLAKDIQIPKSLVAVSMRSTALLAEGEADGTAPASSKKKGAKKGGKSAKKEAKKKETAAATKKKKEKKKETATDGSKKKKATKKV